MDKIIIVFDTDIKQCKEICGFLEKQQYKAIPMHSLANLESYLNKNACMTVIIDLNNTAINNSVIRGLAINNPGIYLLGTTKSRFNPELKDTLCCYIFACLTKPINTEELVYWLKTIEEDNENPVNSLVE